jgi:DNA-binding NtrC family response regulator
MREPWGKDQSVAIVDDSIDFCHTFRKCLRKQGFEGKFRCFPTGRSFFASKFDFDMVVCDLDLPVMNGFEVRKKLSEVKPNMPFVYCSANADMLDHVYSDMKIIKPFNITEVMEIVKKCLN